jgi:hypothetical protein
LFIGYPTIPNRHIHSVTASNLRQFFCAAQAYPLTHTYPQAINLPI